ncbi:MAG: M20/M25/M40 family metallo-hydrolase [Longicatena sp.]
MNKEFLKEMLETPSVSGNEIALQKKVMAYMSECCDKIHHDNTGDVISILNPSSKAKVLLCGHIDEIGFLVTNITSDGMLKVTKAGGIHPILYLGTHVQIMTKDTVLAGIVVTTAALEKSSAIGIEDISIDIGAKSKEEASSYVAIGDSVCAATSSKDLLNNHFCGRALDDRIGAFIILEALKRAKELKATCGIYAATTVGEETTMRGAYHCASYVKPSCAIIVDVTFASDYASISEYSSGRVDLDGGLVLCKSSMINTKLNEALTSIAKELDMHVQWEVFAGKAGTDGDVVHFTNGGVPIALISIPLRYMHSSIESASYQDMEEIIAVLAEFLVRFDESFNFDPFL